MITRFELIPLGAVVALLSLSGTSSLAQYDPPASYYDSATGTGLTLKNNLHAIISGHTVISYTNRVAPLQTLDEDPANSANLLVIYSGYSVPKSQFPGGSADTEHLWPRSRGIDTSGPDNSDLFNMRPCDASVNGSRSNKYFDDVGGSNPAHAEAPECRADSTRWEPRPVDKGDIARAMFYMAVRYDGADSATTDLELVNGAPTGSEMGNLAAFLDWHYQDPVTDAERLRNHLIYQYQPTYQGNRNPFVDRPEFVWAIWGPTPNDSKLYFGPTPPSNGASTITAEFRVIRNASPPSLIETLNKSGTTPTTYNVTLAGDIASPAAGNGQAFVSGATALLIDVAVTSTASVGLRAGTLTVDNTDLTSAGAGLGSLDGNDSVDVSVEVLDHASASFSPSAAQSTLTINFGTVALGGGPAQQTFRVYNREITPGFTAALDMDSIGGAGDTARLSTNWTPASGLPAGSSRLLTATLNTTAAGQFAAVYTLNVSDEDIPGATAGTPLTLKLLGEVAAGGPIFPFDDDGDGDIDLLDFAGFFDCFTGPAGGPYSPPCQNHDADADGDVDVYDLALLQNSFTG